MSKTILIITVLVFSLVSEAQIFRDKTLCHDSGIRLVKTKYYNYGFIRKPYRVVERVGAMGRTTEREGFKKNKLAMKTEYLYNNNGDVIREIYFDHLNTTQADTIIYKYEYSNGRIALQKETWSHGDSTTYMLINSTDTSLTYQRTIYHFLPDKKFENQVVQNYTFTYDGNLLKRQKRMETDGSGDITMYEYNDNGEMKRRVVEMFPKNTSGIINSYAGGTPASDDQLYSYSYDDNGRVAEYFTTVNGKTFKLASYRYK